MKATICCAQTSRTSRQPSSGTFKELKSDLAIRPIYHQKDERIEAHIFVAFLAYCVQVTLKARLKPLASGLTARAVLEKLAGMQMLAGTCRPLTGAN